MDPADALDILSAEPTRTGILTDFDGTLSAVADRPSEVRAVPGAAEVLGALAGVFGIVGVISGRPLEDLSERLKPAGAVLVASYGAERSDRVGPRQRPQAWEAIGIAASGATEGMEGVIVERSGAGIALHFRAAPEAEGEVLEVADELATAFELEVRRGHLVVEVAVPGRGKASAVTDLLDGRTLDVVCYAGDDSTDLEAFTRVRDMAPESVLIAVSGEQTPDELCALADVVAASPGEYVGFLEDLRDAVAG